MKKLILLITLLTTVTAYAQNCSSYDQDKMAYLSERYGKQLVRSKYDGGQNIRVSVTSCQYNSYSEQYNVGIDISWNGSISGKYYNSMGTMKVDSSNITYNETYRNKNLSDYAFWRGMAMLTVIMGVATSGQ